MSFIKRFRLSLESLSESIAETSYVVAFSGGVDSHVLLHCCKELGLTVRAVHVHHGLQAVADEWVGHCQSVCYASNIHLDVLYVDARKNKGQSPEEAARIARYSALQDNLSDTDYLLTAQHLNDQAETLLLQLFRSAGSAGLSAMPQRKNIGEHVHLRPLLSFSRQDIERYADESGLRWVEDPSNEDVSFDRNYLRRNILPLLEQRWPEVVAQLSAVSKLQASNVQVMEDMAAIDLANAMQGVVCKSRPGIYETVSILSIDRLKQLSSARLLNVLRYWLREMQCSPTRNLLQEIEKTLVNSSQDVLSCIRFNDIELRKFHNALYLLGKKGDTNNEVIPDKTPWSPSLVLGFPALNIQIESELMAGAGLDKSLLSETLTVSFRKGGENFHPAERQHSQRLKKLLQEANVPLWERDTIPLVYFKDELIAVAGLWVCQKYSVANGEEGWVVGVADLQLF